jgi:hypothetical protein
MMSGDWGLAKRLPEDPAYWERLAARAVDAARPGGWWLSLSDSAFLLAASAVVALLGGALLVGERVPDAVPAASAIARALAPDDPLLRSLLDSPGSGPPAASLLTLGAAREEQP